MQRHDILLEIRSPIELMPASILIQIFSYLYLDDLASLMLVSKSLNEIAKSNPVWKNNFKFHFFGNQPTNTTQPDWRGEFIIRALNEFPRRKRLFLLISENNIEKLKLEKIDGADLTLADNVFRPVYILAVTKNNQEMLDFIFGIVLKKLPKANIFYWIALCNQSAASIKTIAKKRLHNIDDTDWSTQGESPLFIAAKYGRTEIVRIFIKAGANINLATSFNTTPLSIATEKGFIDIVRLLLEHNADTTIANKFGDTPLHIACERNRIKLVELLLTKCDVNIVKNGCTPLLKAVQSGHTEIVKLLLENGAGSNSYSALFLAALNGYNDIVKLLLENKDVDINAFDSKLGLTSLHGAASMGHAEVVNTLCRYGAKTNKILVQPSDTDNEKYPKGATPLFLAAANGRIEVVKTLLSEKNININLACVNGATPLSIAQKKGHEKIVILLENYQKLIEGREQASNKLVLDYDKKRKEAPSNQDSDTVLLKKQKKSTTTEQLERARHQKR